MLLSLLLIQYIFEKFYIINCNSMAFYSVLADTKIDNFKHNNMTPFFGGTIKQSVDYSANNTILEKYTGMDNQLVIPKQELSSFNDIYNNRKDNEQEVKGYELQQSRMHKPVTYNNTLPVEQIRVGVGTKHTDPSKPSGGFQQDEYRNIAMYKSTDELRVATKPKETYKARTLNGMKEKKSGNIGKVDKNRVDTFYEKTQDDLFTTTGSYLKPKNRPCTELKDTNRLHNSVAYSGIPYQNKGSRKVGVMKNPSKVQLKSCSNNESNIKTQPHDLSTDDYGRKNILLYTNERDLTTSKSHVGNLSTYVKSMMSPIMDVVKRTNKELSVQNAREFGPMQTLVKKQTIYNPNSIAKTTIKETLIHDNHTGQLTSQKKENIVYDPREIAKTTIRETLKHNDNTINMTGHTKQTVYNPNDTAKTTIKETLIDNNNIGNISGLDNGNGYLTTNMTAPVTNKQITSDNEYLGNPDNENSDGYKNAEFKAKVTNKQITSDHEHIGIPAGNLEMKSYQDIYNAVINSTRETLEVQPPPTKTNTKITNGTDNVVLTSIPKDKTQCVNEHISRIYQKYLDKDSQQLTKYKEQYHEISNDRIDANLLNAFKNNPYTHPLNSVV